MYIPPASMVKIFVSTATSALELIESFPYPAVPLLLKCGDLAQVLLHRGALVVAHALGGTGGGPCTGCQFQTLLYVYNPSKGLQVSAHL